MRQAKAVTLRIPLLLLAIADLIGLALRLRPWQEIVNLPGQGTIGFDPAICLAAYIFLMFWISGNRNPELQRALAAGTMLGLPAGVLLIGQVLLKERPGAPLLYLQLGLMTGAGVLWGLAGLRGARAAGSAPIGIIAGAWSAMVSALMACAMILARLNLSRPLPLTMDPWKQYEGLAIGNEAMQFLVHSLTAAAGFLLISPLVGGAVGLIFAITRHDEPK